MKYDIEIYFDRDIHELLKDEGITTSTLYNVFEKFVQEEMTLIDNEIANFILPFINPISYKRYTLYGNYQFKNSHIEFEVELVGISIKTVKIKPC
ncbi:hypothetical protein GOM49_16105 [Clostridium bovifaecis]|uniref:Uncharacterized protein n=2 Tax=Clostridia TaxID=186801 RepID=A0A1V4I446_9FIRM|nr:hypothetical protein CLOTH_19640 [[Clostridium] thermoalcaliphilum]QGU96414.1 hypothetical protein GOM49_16105 [Clostridium bovifaecis]